VKDGNIEVSIEVGEIYDVGAAAEGAERRSACCDLGGGDSGGKSDEDEREENTACVDHWTSCIFSTG